jgi:hypothetical protein
MMRMRMLLTLERLSRGEIDKLVLVWLLQEMGTIWQISCTIIHR